MTQFERKREQAELQRLRDLKAAQTTEEALRRNRELTGHATLFPENHKFDFHRRMQARLAKLASED